MCSRVARVLVAGGGAEEIQDTVLSARGGGEYIAKFAQGNCYLITMFVDALPVLDFVSSVAVGPGPVKYMQKVLQDPMAQGDPVIGKTHHVVVLKWLSDQVIRAICGQLSSPLNALGQLVGPMLWSRAAHLGATRAFPILHNFQVRACVSFHRFLSSANAPIVYGFAALAAASALEIWARYVASKGKKQGNEQVVQQRGKKRRRLAASKTSTIKHLACKVAECDGVGTSYTKVSSKFMTFHRDLCGMSWNCRAKSYKESSKRRATKSQKAD